MALPPANWKALNGDDFYCSRPAFVLICKSCNGAGGLNALSHPSIDPVRKIVYTEERPVRKMIFVNHPGKMSRAAACTNCPAKGRVGLE